MSPTVAPRSPQIMLYFSRPLGMSGIGNAASHPTFGFRVAQVRLMADNGSPEAGDPLQHRELLNLEMSGRSESRIQLGGHRVTYNFTHASFGSQPRSIIPVSALAMRGLPNPTPRNDNLPRSAASGLRSTDVTTGHFGGNRLDARAAQSSRSADVFHESSFARELASVAASAFGSSRLNPTQRLLPSPPRPNVLRGNATN